MKPLTANAYRPKRRRLARELAALLTDPDSTPPAMRRWEQALARLWKRYSATIQMTRRQRERCSRCGAPPAMEGRLPVNGRCIRHVGAPEPRSFPFEALDFDLVLDHVPGDRSAMAPPVLQVFVDFVEVDAAAWVACASEVEPELALVDYA